MSDGIRDQGSRYREIDGVRGIAILMMVIFHLVFDLGYFDIFPVSTSSGFWRYFGLSTASLFLLIVGVSFSLSYARTAETISGWQLYRKFLYRGAGIFALGILVTLGTWWYLGEGYVIFGILHLIGISIILAPFFYRFGLSNLLMGGICILIGLAIGNSPGPAWLLPLGIHPAPFWSVDYTPLFPWFGVVLIGMGVGSLLYPDGTRRFSLPFSLPGWSSVLEFAGKHSLVIYLVHQPIIILLLLVFTGKVPV
ncbi:heparan-alpha-glucosaminide N-acetyltransferase [Methanoregula formicica]|jgi:uncharacterized membrane protein|uniref:Putative membrane protein n=1 Tax=Methanoregula formicica (strain DSM 22288 / NBRC 105244 / SMSP) TaxID=593750 RepID=L0HHD1_METFS|nr:heparan-alpha-glucosaminide N-acetyltransferase [Methanoregula formicica]AGB03445.1 putative membrane protein [Methanoregula formicica SMSP]